MINRDLLAKALPGNPRLIAQFQAAFDVVDSLTDQATQLQAQLTALASEAGLEGLQPENALLTSISALNGLGAIEITGDGQANVRGIDAADQASILTRGTAYDTFVAYGGQGPTTARPVVPSNVVAIYFDTTLHAAPGKPVFNYLGTGWVDATGASA